MYPADPQLHIIVSVTNRNGYIRDSAGPFYFFLQALCRRVKKQVKAYPLHSVLFTQQLNELNKILCIPGWSFLLSAFPAAVIILIQAPQLPVCQIKTCRLKCRGVLLSIVPADGNNRKAVNTCQRPVNVLLAEHVVNDFVYADALPQPYPFILTGIYKVQCFR